ncbi:MAG TPA: hypothetical protein VFY29_15110 [Terriglobia bacterium]|nr:hypothetical protein [Terriglobia bacterium]
MAGSHPACPQCHRWLRPEILNVSGMAACASCGTPLQVEVFPALFRRSSPGQSGEAVLVEGESTCFFHPQKRAVLSCQSCGRFLCALCDCAISESHFCPLCLEQGKATGRIKALDDRRTLYDSIALSVAVLPVALFFFATFVTAPIALFIAIRYWKAPLSLARRSRIRFVFAIAFASAELVAWIVIVAMLVMELNA